MFVKYYCLVVNFFQIEVQMCRITLSHFLIHFHFLEFLSNKKLSNHVFMKYKGNLCVIPIEITSDEERLRSIHLDLTFRKHR